MAKALRRLALALLSHTGFLLIRSVLVHTLGVTAVGLWVLLLHYVMSRNIGQLRGKEEKKKKSVLPLLFRIL